MKDTTPKTYRYMTYINGAFFISNATIDKSQRAALLHFHNGCEIIFITQGKYKMYAPDKMYEGSGPCLGIFQSGMYHGCIFTDCEESPAKRYVINYTQDLLDRIPPVMLDTQALFENDAVVVPLDEHSFELFSVLFGELYDIYVKQIASKNSKIILPQMCGYMAVILNAINDIYQKSDAISFNARKSNDGYIYTIVRDLLKAVENNENVSAELMAEKMFVSRAKLLADFRRVTGKNFKQMTDELRLERIKKKLCLGLSNKEIAEECGFSSESYFIQFFKKHMDISPGEYRSENYIPNQKT